MVEINNEQLMVIKKFCNQAKYYMVSFSRKEDEEFGKIIDNTELLKVNLSRNEIYRSISYKNNDTLFVFDLKPKNVQYIDNPIQLIIKNLADAKIIESIYKGIFRWVFDGLSVKAYAIVPSGNNISNGTLTRYGGTEMFIKILRQHLENVCKTYKGLCPDYNFSKINNELEETELSIGSINKFNNNYSIGIISDMDFKTVLKNSKNNVQTWSSMNVLNMKYWSREINPDLIVEAKHFKLTQTLDIKNSFDMYPACIKNIMNLQKKGNANRFKLGNFLLSIHKQRDAKFIYDSVMSPKELDHITNGDCSGQWNIIKNNVKRYGSPTCRQVGKFCNKNCPLSHPLEYIQFKLDEKDEENKR